MERMLYRSMSDGHNISIFILKLLKNIYPLHWSFLATYYDHTAKVVTQVIEKHDRITNLYVIDRKLFKLVS